MNFKRHKIPNDIILRNVEIRKHPNSMPNKHQRKDYSFTGAHFRLQINESLSPRPSSSSNFLWRRVINIPTSILSLSTPDNSRRTISNLDATSLLASESLLAGFDGRSVSRFFMTRDRLICWLFSIACFRSAPVSFLSKGGGFENPVPWAVVGRVLVAVLALLRHS